MLFGAIADDITGGVELASMLVAAGVRTEFHIGNGGAMTKEAPATVIALKTRVAAPDLAVASVRKATERLKSAGCRHFFFKYCATFDSTPEGNIGPCVEGMMDSLKAHNTIFCPSFCEFGRTVYQGHHFVDEVPLSESPKRHDPLTPMTDSNLVRVLQAQSRRRVGLVPYQIVTRGAAAIKSALQSLVEAGRPLAIVDAVVEDNLRAIAEATAELALATGNSSVAAHYPEAWRRRGWISSDEAPDPLPAIDGPAAVLAGSCAEATLRQLALFGERHPVLRLDMDRAFTADIVAEALDWAAPHLESGTPIAIATGAEPEIVARLQETHGRKAIASRAEEILAELAHALVGRGRVRRLVVAGGETSGSILARLGIRRLAVGPYAGAGLSRCVAAGEDPIGLVLKSGKLGKPDIFERAIEAMAQSSNAQADLSRARL
ncbi:MAG TPA: 3-oxo-tetronate kinase [Rhizobiaceae bacterium]|jgi:uncharacterized protein YgbK (DUF1537 family)|nr:3-oxo-tetronate kinase [Rhizobiaceae bacterium]